MKYLILTSLIFSYSTIVYSQASMNDEGALNQKLIDNSTASQNTNAAKSAPSSIKILSSGGSATTSAKNLTDQEKQLSENFVHQGMANRIIKEKCGSSAQMQQACDGQAVDHKIMGMNPAMIKVASQMYAVFGSMGDALSLSKSKDVPKDSGKPTEATANTDASKAPAKEKEKASDYCKYIPTATEMLATFNQKNTTDALNAGGETSQKEALFKAAKSHDSRAEQAQIQAAGWFGGAACYAIRAATGSVIADGSWWIKLGAATFLGAVYQEEVGANKEYAQKTRDVANSLPGLGKCNPVTERTCYCAQPETQYDKTYCMPEINAKSAAASSYTKVACTDGKLQIDPNCACEKTNTCFDKFLENQGASELSIGIANSNSPFRAITSLAHGRLEASTLGAQSINQLAAIAKKTLSESFNKIPDEGMLNASQKEASDALVSKGIPSNVAHLLAKNPPPESAVNGAMAKFQGLGSSSYKMASIEGGSKNNVLDFSGGNGLGISGKKAGEKKNGMDDLMGKLNPNSKGTTGNAKVLEFAQKAQANAAQITKTDRPLFEIISLRYQTSGRRLLELDQNN